MPYPLPDDHDMVIPFDTCTIYGLSDIIQLSVQREAEKPVMVSIHYASWPDTIYHNRRYTWNDRGEISRMQMINNQSFLDVFTREEKPFFDGNHRLLGDSVFSGTQGKQQSLETQNIYYNDAGQVSDVYTTDNRYPETLKQYFSYNASGNLVRITYNYGVAYYDSLSYDNAGRLLFFGANFPSGDACQLHYNNNGLVDTLMFGRWGSNGIIGSQVVLYYNSFNHPDSATMATNQRRSTIRYYYEEYDTTATVIISAQPLTIYPNPVSDRFTIRWGTQMPAGPVQVALFGITGQFSQKIQMAKPGAETTVELPQLATGIYYINIKTPQGQTIHHQPLFISH